MELQGTITAYLSYYINASAAAKRKSDALISKYLRTRLGRGRRTAAEVEETLKKRGNTSHWRMPPEKKPLADRRLHAMIGEVHSLRAGEPKR